MNTFYHILGWSLAVGIWTLFAILGGYSWARARTYHYESFCHVVDQKLAHWLNGRMGNYAESQYGKSDIRWLWERNPVRRGANAQRKEANLHTPVLERIKE